MSFACETGPRELLTHGENGLLVEPENIDAMAEALLRVMRSHALRKELGTAAAQASLMFNGDRVASGWEKILTAPAERIDRRQR